MNNEFLINRITESCQERSEQILGLLEVERHTSFRVNTLLGTADEIEEKLNAAQIEFQKNEIINNAYTLVNSDYKKLTALDIYNDGKIYVQNPSSMIPPVLLNPKPGETILDMCAAPGGKTTMIAALSENRASITACEKNPNRAKRLQYNLDKQGVKGAFVMKTDSRQLDDLFRFDKILLDAPCSGTGTFSKYNSTDNFSKELLERSVATQKKLIEKAYRILKTGGILVYSTCSLLKEEDEQIAEFALKHGKFTREQIPERFNALDLVNKDTFFVKVMPDDIYEGFFVAVLRKNK